MYVSKSLNTPRQQKKPVIPDSPKGGNRSKKKSPRPQVSGSEASGAAMGTVENTAVFFISPTSDVKEEVLRYYEINKRSPSISKNQQLPNSSSTFKNQFKTIAEDFFERLDSRGKMIKIRRLHTQQEMIDHAADPAFYQENIQNGTDFLDLLGYPYSTFNLHPLSYISQHDLKARANSLAYTRYKLIKREAARK